MECQLGIPIYTRVIYNLDFISLPPPLPKPPLFSPLSPRCPIKHMVRIIIIIGLPLPIDGSHQELHGSRSDDTEAQNPNHHQIRFAELLRPHDVIPGPARIERVRLPTNVSGSGTVDGWMDASNRRHRAQVPKPRYKGRCRSNTHLAVTTLEYLTAKRQQAGIGIRPSSRRPSHLVQVMHIGTVGPSPNPTMSKPKYRTQGPAA